MVGLSGASNSSQSFGARFNKIPKSISTHGGTKSVDLTRNPVMGTFRVGRSSRHSQPQYLLPNSQSEQSAHSPIITQHQDPPEWRKLPEPSQSGQSILPSQLARLPSLRHIVNETVPQRDHTFMQATHQPTGYSTDKISAIANRTPLARMPSDSVDHQSLGDNRHVNPGFSNASGVVLYQDLQNAQVAGNFIIRSDWYSSQEAFSGYPRYEPEPRQPALRDPNSSSGRIGGSVEHDQAKIRKAHRQHRREQTEAIRQQGQQTRQDTVGQDEPHQGPMLGNVQSFGPAMHSTYPAIHQGQAFGNLESRRPTPTPPVGPFQPNPYLLSPGKWNFSKRNVIC